MVVWTDYMKYRAEVRGFSLEEIERIVRQSNERYFDVSSGRHIVVGRHHEVLVVIPYEREDEVVTPVTIHTTSRQQVNFRVKTGRFVYE